MEQLEALQRENARLREENRLLRQKLDIVIRQLFGSKSEKLDPGQLELLLGGEDAGLGKAHASGAEALLEAEESGAPKRRRRNARKPRIPENLPVVETIIDPDPVCGCPEAWRCIGEEISEQLDYEPGRFLRRRTVRRKYVKRSEPELPPIIAVLPERLVERGLLAPGLLAHVMISKYADHLPLYRLERIFRERHGVDLPRQTMCRAVEQVADWLKPIVAEMSREQFAGGYVQIDETPVKYQQPGRGKTAQGYFWTAHVPGGDTVYHWYPGRGHECLKALVPKNFDGTIQCDGYGAYKTSRAVRPLVSLAGCWAHARRNFHVALEQRDSPVRAAWLLRQIGHLYRIEKRLRRSRAGPVLRAAVRQAESRMIIERIYKALDRFKRSKAHLPQSLMGKAIDYALGQWPELMAYLEDGALEIDNNLVENAIRPTAVGKKNWLFIGANEAGWRSAVVYSIITTCRNRGIDPCEYLRDVLERLPTMTNFQIPEITPRAWAEARQKSMTIAS
jgi:transposase